MTDTILRGNIGRARTGIVLVAAVAIVATAAFARVKSRVLAQSGLHANYSKVGFYDYSAASTAWFESVSLDTLRRRGAELGGPLSGADWQGYLIVPVTARYRFAADVDDAVTMEIDWDPVIHLATPGSQLAERPLTRGLHPIRIRYEDRGGVQKLSLYWSREDDALSPIPRELLVPRTVSAAEARTRRILALATPLVPLFDSVLLLGVLSWAAAAALRRLLPADAPTLRSTKIVCGIAAVIFVAGLAWGLPDYEGWAADELTPDDVSGAVEQRFAHGWAGIYPPLHFAVLATAGAPFHILSAAGESAQDDIRVASALIVVHRLVSLLMALGIVALAVRFASRFSPRAGLLAGLFTVCILPLVYYAKVANVDVPYVFWVMLSLSFYARARESGAARDFLLFATCGAAAIATKDQAFGFFVLPALAIVWSAVRRRQPSVAVLALTVGVTAIALAVTFNLPFNYRGVAEHLRIISGSGSAPYRVYGWSLVEQARLAVDSVAQLGGALGWPLFVVSAVAAVAAWWGRIRPLRGLLLAFASYYLTVIVVVGYHYDRFFLGPAVMLVICAGWGVDRWIAMRPSPVMRAAVGVLLAAGLLRTVALDVLMLRDSRYAAEAWLLAHAAPETKVAAAGQYLPRRAVLFWTPLPQDLDELARMNPDYVILNVGYSLRQLPGTRRGDLYQALAGGRTPYRRVFQYRARPAWSQLRFDRRFTEPTEDSGSNLSKINPLIEIYSR